MNGKKKVIIVDDEQLAREDLKAVLKNFPELEIVAEADNPNDAKKQIDLMHPDIIFLDIQMPGKSGFDLLQEIHTDAKIIFVTAYDEFALRAFEVNAQDYLLKPVNRERLALAIEHLQKNKEEKIEDMRKFEDDDNIFLMVNNTYHFVKVRSLVKIISAGNYSEIYSTSKLKGLVLKSMREWEARLPSNIFVRIHRNAIINLDYLDHIEEWFNYSYQVYLQGIEKPLVMSRRYAAKLKERMG